MTFPADATLADIGEFRLIRSMTDLFGQGERVLLGPGDDAAVLSCPDGRVVVSTDLHVDTRHFRRDWASATDIGRRVAAANLSDISAMGGRATALTVGLAAPRDLPASWALELAQGLAQECELVGASVVGGDLTAADQVMVAVTALGRRPGSRYAAPGPGPATCWHWPDGRAGPPAASRCWPGGSGPPVLWSTPTDAPSRRTPPARRPPRRVPRR